MAQTEKRLETLLQKANGLPRSPGVYIMKNVRGQVIYVGKSRVLRNRVSQYFQRIADHNEKTRRMVMQVCDFDYILTDTEMEALTLENSLIKHHSPKYNIRLKDDKNYPYIRISKEEYPTITMVRRRSADRAKYYGPFSSSQTVWQLIGALQKIFGLARCKMRFPEDIGKKRPCIYAQMGACVAPCTGEVSAGEYRALFDQIHALLHGSSTEVKRELTAQMEEASEQLEFERAAQLRDRLQLIGKIWEKQKVVGAPGTEQDVFAVWRGEACQCVTVFYIRDGMLLDTEHQFFGADQLLEEENFSQFLTMFYQKRQYIPKEILLACGMEEQTLRTLEQWLSEQAEYRVRLSVPVRGDRRALCEMARENAEQFGRQYQMRNEKDQAALEKLAALLKLEVVPSRIEAYDISNLGAEHTTAGMAVMLDGVFAKKEYRTFSIQSVVQDDYGAMREALTRRFTHYLKGDAGFDQRPDLLLLDGGVGHVSTAKQVLEELQIFVPVYGMVKDAYHKTRVLTDGEREINISHEQSVFVLLYRLQEEVHRYTVGKMQHAKRRTVKHSSLEKIPGIGPARAKKLLAHFGGLAGVRNAEEDALRGVCGITEETARNIYRYFHSDFDKAGVLPDRERKEE